MNKIRFLSLIFIMIISACATTNAPKPSSEPQINQGYGTIDASKNTTAISQIEIDQKESATVTWMELLQRTAGVTVRGQGNNLSILIRGKKSINGSQEPLFVVGNTPMGQGFSSIAFIDPSLVKRISILKDAASASSYGSRGANGVVIVTLK